MDAWIDLARGPLFRFSLAVCVLGLALPGRAPATPLLRAWWRAGDRLLPLPAIARATLGWIVPRRLLRARPLYSLASFAFHARHPRGAALPRRPRGLWQQDLPVRWPMLSSPRGRRADPRGPGGSVRGLLARALTKESRALTRTQDVVVLVLLAGVLATGFLAAHPALAPFDARALLLAHLLLGDLALILTPMTKIVHCILFPFMQLAFEVGWHFPAESGRHVALALGKEDERV